MATRRENPPTVSISKTISVFPKTVDPQTVLELSNLDRQCPLPMFLVLFYSQPLSSQYSNLDSGFNSLKSGLEETLDAYYPAAGRLRQGQSDGKLNLWCNNGGAILVEAVTEVKISELGDLSVYNEFFEKLVYKPVSDGQISEMPLLVAQVTKFGCGGYSIGTGTSHSLFDGPSAYDFLASWASNSAIFEGKKGCELQKPVHERGLLLNVQNPLSGRKTSAIDHLYQMIRQASGDGRVQIDRKNYVLKTYRLSGAMIQDLKKKVAGENSSIRCSSFDVLAAHLWKARTKALSVSEEKTVCLQFAVDVRKKMKPPLPKGFSGNAYVLASVGLPVKQLEEEPLDSIVDKIRKAKNSIDNDYVNAYIQGLDQGPQFPSSSSSSPSSSLPPLDELTVISEWTRMPFHEIKFFNGGVAYASPVMPPLPEVAFLLQNPNDDHGVDVRIGLAPEVTANFSNIFFNNINLNNPDKI